MYVPIVGKIVEIEIVEKIVGEMAIGHWPWSLDIGHWPLTIRRESIIACRLEWLSFRHSQVFGKYLRSGPECNIIYRRFTTSKIMSYSKGVAYSIVEYTRFRDKKRLKFII